MHHLPTILFFLSKLCFSLFYSNDHVRLCVKYKLMLIISYRNDSQSISVFVAYRMFCLESNIILSSNYRTLRSRLSFRAFKAQNSPQLTEVTSLTSPEPRPVALMRAIVLVKDPPNLRPNELCPHPPPHLLLPTRPMNLVLSYLTAVH